MAVFAPSGPAPLSTVSLQGSQAPTIANVALAVANTEYSYSLPAGTKQFRLRLRGSATLKLAYSAGTSGTTYYTIFPGDTYSVDSVTLATGLTLYFQATLATQIAEIESWA